MTQDRRVANLIKFLDRLSWMCDFETGGSSVCAIAMQPTKTSTTFWYAIHHKFVSKTQDNFENLLERLRTAAKYSEREANLLERELCTEYITYAAKKFQNYTRKLQTLIEKIPEIEAPSDIPLMQDLQCLIALADYPIELCSAANHFRDSESLRCIAEKIKKRSMSDKWSSIRHCIGRLGSWHRAVHTLVEYARSEPEIFQAFKIEAVKIPKAIRAPGSDDSVDLLGALRRMWPLEQESELSRAVNALDRLRKSDIAEEFKQAYANKNFRPRVHAEVCLLNHFYENELPFVEAYRYIGCSKPSCYCCDLHFSLHPGQFVRRHSHGNVWINWAPIPQRLPRRKSPSYKQ